MGEAQRAMPRAERWPSRFRPAWWLRGAHRQTIGARLLRRRTGVSFSRDRVETPDGDFLDLEFARVAGSALSATDPLVVVLHGLEGSARSGYALETYRQLAAVGLAAVGLNFRSCSGEPNRAPRLYHSGETGDLTFVLEHLARRDPDRPLAAVGFSLGGNVLLKLLGERGAAAAGLLTAAAAISVPFDLAAGARFMESGFSRLYVRRLLRSLRAKVRARAAELAPRVDVPRALAARTFREFDDAATAPLHGFSGADDYYRRSSCGQFLGAISVPTLVLHSRDDPFVPSEAIPHSVLVANPWLTARITERGGHVGFACGVVPGRASFWAETEAARFIGRAVPWV